MWNLRNKTAEHKEREGKIKRKKEANHKRLLNTENTLRAAGGRGGGMGITCDEHWVLSVSDESLSYISEIIITLDVN